MKAINVLKEGMRSRLAALRMAGHLNTYSDLDRRGALPLDMPPAGAIQNEMFHLRGRKLKNVVLCAKVS